MSKLTLREQMWIREGHKFGSGTPFNYTVIGLPSGIEVDISNHEPGTGWQVLRIVHGKMGEWGGDYTTKEDALAAIEKEFL